MSSDALIDNLEKLFHDGEQQRTRSRMATEALRKAEGDHHAAHASLRTMYKQHRALAGRLSALHATMQSLSDENAPTVQANALVEELANRTALRAKGTHGNVKQQRHVLEDAVASLKQTHQAAETSSSAFGALMREVHAAETLARQQEEQAKAARQAREALEERLKHAELKAREVEAQVDEMELGIVEQQKTLAARTSEVAGVRAQVQEAKARVERADRVLSETKAETTAVRLDEMNAIQNASRSVQDALEGAGDDVLGVLDDHRAALQHEEAKQQARAEMLEQRHAELQQRLHLSSTNETQLGESVAHLTEVNLEHDTRIEELQRAVDELDAEHATRHEELAAMLELNATRTADLSTMQEERRQALASLGEAKSKLSVMRKALADWRSLAAQLVDDDSAAGKVVRRVQDAVASLEDAKAQCAAHHSAIDDSAERIERAEQLAQLNARKAELEETHAQEAEQSRATAERYAEELRTLNAHIEGLRDRRAMNAEFRKMQDACAQLAQDLAKEASTKRRLEAGSSPIGPV